MSDAPTVIRFRDVGKMYKIFPNRGDNLVDALGLARVMRWRSPRHREFWALRSIDFELKKGQRLGIIGRNGAGKSTLLKLITGNLTPSEGEISVTGDVQALLEIGGGLHPEFTGAENIQAALVHLGLSPREIAEAADDIAEFTELGTFLDQPFKTYSLGMQARLSFAIGTTVRPEILIIDEILGAGDAYFFGKSTARMQELIEGGASVLLASHGLDQVVRFCDQTIWLDRGRIAMRGPSVEVVKAYDKFIRELEDKRLQAKNRKVRERRFDAFAREGYTDYITVQCTAPPEDGRLDVAMVQLDRDGALEDEVTLGDAQDADASQSAWLDAENGNWSPPAESEDGYFRSLESGGAGEVGHGAFGQVVFNLWFYYPDSKYKVTVRYRTNGPGATIAVGRGGTLRSVVELGHSPDWATIEIPYTEDDKAATPVEIEAGGAQSGPAAPSPRVSRWPGEGSLLIDDVRLVDETGEQQAVFGAGTPMTLVVTVRATKSSTFEVTPAATLFRADGILVSNNPGPAMVVRAAEGETFELALDFGRLNLGDGRYLFSVALYRALNHPEPSIPYDLIDRSYEFEVRGNEAYNNGVFRHAATWARDDRRRPVPSPSVTPDPGGLRGRRREAV